MNTRQAVTDVDALAERWHVHPNSVRAAIRRNEIKVFRLGRRILIPLSEVKRLESSGGATPSDVILD